MKHLPEFYSVLERFGLKPEAPNFAYKTDMRRHAWTTKRAVKIAGLAAIACVTWTLTYDNLSKGILEAERKSFLQDTISGAEYVATTVVFLTTTGGATWTKDATWNDSNNLVEAIGVGGAGGAGSSGGVFVTLPRGGGGGGGGAFALKANVSLAGNPSYTIGADSSVTDTNFHSGQVIAKAGTAGGAASNGSGGAAASCTPSTGAFSGGAGGASGTAAGAGSGGGAAGPSGAGSAGNTGSGSCPGGAANNGTVAGGAHATVGNAGTNWNGTHGSGSGGGGRNSNGAGLAGGVYGGGGGGGFSPGFGGGAGKQGIIVLTWTPAGGHRMFIVF